MIKKNYILWNNKTKFEQYILYKKNVFKICTVKVRITPPTLSEQLNFFEYGYINRENSFSSDN